MATGRTKIKHWRVYVDGYDMSGYSRSIGPLDVTYDEVDLTAYMGDSVKGYLPNLPQANVGTLNTVFDNTATVGVHTILRTAGTSYRNVMVPIGIRGDPADGDPCFGGTFLQSAYQTTEDGGAVTVTIPFAGWSGVSTPLYALPWGTLLHAKAVRLEATGANADAGFLSITGGATAKGGYFLYQVFAGDGTATLLVEDSDDWDDPADYDVTIATTGLINCAAPTSGMVVLASNAAVREGVRWQIDFNAGGGTATTVTFACAFMRAIQK